MTTKSPELVQSVRLPLSKLETNKGQIEGLPKNPRFIRDEKFKKLVRSIEDNPEMTALREVLVYPHNGKYIIIGGNMRYQALKELGYKEAICKILPENTTPEQLQAYTIKDNAGFGEWDFDLLGNDWDAGLLDLWGVDVPEVDTEVSEENEVEQTQELKGNLKDRFIVPPFSILDTRQGYWQDRKKQWRAYIGDLGGSRKGVLRGSLMRMYPTIYTRSKDERKRLGISFEEYLERYVTEEEKEKLKSSTYAQNVSLFDPVLSEILCKWFTPNNHSAIFDCFAGDTQKGLVFAYCGHEFTGIELRQEQVDVNIEVIKDRGLPIRYICDDGRNVSKYFDAESMDLLFSCPPYFDIEVYSDDERDASNQGSYNDFINIIDNAFKNAITRLKNNRFAVVVVGDVRNKKTGFYYDFCGDIKRIFKEAGMNLLNELILVEQVGATAIAAARHMKHRKVAKTHQNVLVFYKGDARNIKDTFPAFEISDDDIAKFTKVDSEE